MNELEKKKQELMKSGKGEKLEELAKSSELKRLGKIVDPEAMKKAAATGDNEALSKMLNQVLSTQDGQELLKRINSSFGK